jgi:hypothetical protein
MAFKFQIQSVDTNTYIYPALSVLENDFIDYTIRAPNDADPASDALLWMTPEDPTIAGFTGAYKAMPYYNPYYGIFLGDTEQTDTFTSNVSGLAPVTTTGTVAGSLKFTATRDALTINLTNTGDGYYRLRINYTNGTKYLISARSDLNRVILSSDPIVSPNSQVSDRWKIIASPL